METHQTHRWATARQAGGQYQSPAGVRSLDGETAAAFVERHRRAHQELGVPLDTERLRKCLSVPSQRTLVERFNELVEQTRDGEGTPF